MQDEHRTALAAGLSALGGEPGRAAAADSQALAAIGRYLALVAEWNERVNLTAIAAPAEMVIKHAVDSATVCGVLPLEPGVRVLDVGSGAGLPGLILKLLVPGARVTLLESVQKKCRFLTHVVQELGLAGTEVVWGRAEDLAHQPRYREQFDVVVARAVAELRVLAELCLPFCRNGGAFIAMKGPGAAAEVAAAAGALGVLGGAVDQVAEVELPEGAGQRNLVIIRKLRAGPRGYPRKAGTPQRKPL